MRSIKNCVAVIIVATILFISYWEGDFQLPSSYAAEPMKILFVRGGANTGGFLEGGLDEHLSDITNSSDHAGNHGWGTLATIL